MFCGEVSSVKLHVPCSPYSLLVFQGGYIVHSVPGTHFAQLVQPLSSKHRATQQMSSGEVFQVSNFKYVVQDTACLCS